MRTVDSHLVDKMDEAVTHYINSHHSGETVHVDTNGLPINVQDDGGGRVVTVMHSQGFTSQMCRQVTINEAVGEGQWGEELLDTDGRLAALVAHLSRASHHQSSHHKMPPVRDMDTSVILDAPMRIFNGQALDQGESIIVEVPQLSPLPSLQEMKRCTGGDWFNNKAKGILKDNTPILTESEAPVLDLGASASPAQSRQPSKKSLPHKKRISRKLKRNNGSCTPQQDIVVINCSEDVAQEEILPDNFVAAVQHQEMHAQGTHHIAHEVRALFICQVCGEFYGEEQLKFFQHLKQHYEPPPHPAIIIENPVSVPDLAIDKMTNTCIVDNVATSTLPDSIVELSLENTVPKTMYQNMDKHILYTSSDKTLSYSSNKLQYTMASVDKEEAVEQDKTDFYETLDKLEMLDKYNCAKCHKSVKKHRHCETHVKEGGVSKLDEMGEFSEPEDLMEGIHVSVEEGEHYEGTLLPHLIVENGHVHQEHVRHWYMRVAGAAGALSPSVFCPVCPPREQEPYHEQEHEHDPRHLKEEMFQRMLEVEVPPADSEFTEAIIPDEALPPPPPAQGTQAGHHAQGPQHAQGAQHAQGSHAAQNAQTHAAQNAQTQAAQNAQTQAAQNAQTQAVQNAQTQAVQNAQTQAAQNAQATHSPQIQSVQSLQAAQTVGVEQTDNKKQKPVKPAKRFECVKCGRVLKHRNSLLYHMLSHADKQQACRDCGKEFYTASALKAHRRVHNDDRPYKCDQCGRAFRQWGVLKSHKSSIHFKQKAFKCEFCNKEFARKYSLNLHRRIHTGECNYKCHYCSKTFRASSYRLTHMRTHTGDKPYKCKECNKGFRATSDLRRHIKTHEKMRSRLEAQNKPKPKDKKTKPDKNVKEEPADQEETTEKTTQEEPEQKTQKPSKAYAAASTTRAAILKNVDKIKVTKKVKKEGAPNVTVTNIIENGQYKINTDYPSNVEVFDTRQNQNGYKLKDFKDEYNDTTQFKDANGPFKNNPLPYKDGINAPEEKGFAILRPIFRGSSHVEPETVKVVRTENTDGKIFTHVEKNGVGEGRNEGLTNGEENAFLERLTALYNIPAI